MLRTEALDYPKSVLIETCTHCNGQCGFCPHTFYRKGKPVQYLEKERFITLITELAQFDVNRITLFCNNEPLIDQRMPEFVALTRKAIPNAEITLSTNGILLSESIASKLYESGLDVLYVSIPTLDPVEYKKLMKYSLKRVLESLEMIARTSAKSIIHIAVPETYAFNRQAFVDYFGARGIEMSSWPIEYRYSWNIFDYVSMSADPARPPSKPCDRPLDQACILANGDMVLCCRDWDSDCCVGNIYDSSIYDLWHSKKMLNLQQLIIQGEYNRIGICKDCSENPHSMLRA